MCGVEANNEWRRRRQCRPVYGCRRCQGWHQCRIINVFNRGARASDREGLLTRGILTGSQLAYTCYPYLDMLVSLLACRRRTTGKRFDIEMKVRASNENALLFWVGERSATAKGDYQYIGLRRGRVEFGFSVGGSAVLVVWNGTRVDDGLWHTVRAQRYVGKPEVVSTSEYLA